VAAGWQAPKKRWRPAPTSDCYCAGRRRYMNSGFAGRARQPVRKFLQDFSAAVQQRPAVRPHFQALAQPAIP